MWSITVVYLLFARVFCPASIGFFVLLHRGEQKEQPWEWLFVVCLCLVLLYRRKDDARNQSSYRLWRDTRWYHETPPGQIDIFTYLQLWWTTFPHGTPPGQIDIYIFKGMIGQLFRNKEGADTKRHIFETLSLCLDEIFPTPPLSALLSWHSSHLAVSILWG